MGSCGDGHGRGLPRRGTAPNAPGFNESLHRWSSGATNRREHWSPCCSPSFTPVAPAPIPEARSRGGLLLADRGRRDRGGGMVLSVASVICPPCGGSGSRSASSRSILVLFLLLLVLGRFRDGALLQPIVIRLARIGFMQRFFRASRPRDGALEPGARERDEEAQHGRVEPEPAGRAEGDEPADAGRAPRLHRGGPGAGRVPDSANRQMRRQAERMQQQARGGRPRRTRKRKRR